jgi:hypothetical protein
MMLEMHFDGPMTDDEFTVFEQQLPLMSDDDVAGYLAFFELLSLEGTTFSDGCARCVFQAENGARAAALARAELSRRP